MKRLLLLGWLLVAPGLYTQTAYANDVAACDPTHAQVPNAVTQVVYAADFPPTNGFIVYVAPTNLDSPERTVYLNGLKAQFDSLKSVPHRYWLCTDTNPIDGVLDSLTEMSQVQKDAMDAPEIAASQAQAVLTQEFSTSEACNGDLDVLEARFRDRFAAAATQAAKANVLIDGLVKVMRCVRAMRGN